VRVFNRNTSSGTWRFFAQALLEVQFPGFLRSLEKAGKKYFFGLLVTENENDFPDLIV